MTSIAEGVEGGLCERGSDCSAGETGTPACGVEVAGDAVVSHHAAGPNVDAEVGVFERTILNATVPEGSSRGIAHEGRDFELVVGVGRQGIGSRNAVTSETVDRMSEGRRGKSGDSI